jgi:hypothetical protein
MKLKIRIMQQPAALLLSVILLLNICFYPAVAWAGEAQLLNDRSADIVNSRALAGMDMVVPGGLTGAGQVVGIADSGLDKGSTTDIHPDLESQSGQMPKVVMLKSFSGRETADDPSGHGTHMAATIAGNGQASAGKYRGIAPGASIYFQALLDENNQLHIPSDINTLFEPAYQAGVRIHVNGWGRAGNYYAPITSQIDKFVWEHPDFLPLFGAGNNGPALATLTSEANSKNGLTIGSSQTPRPSLSPDDQFADQAASTSSLGPAGDGRIKPELLAPGSAVISACSSLIESNYAGNPMYTIMGGSSMATAVVGGSVALLSEYLKKSNINKDPSAALLKALLVNGARRLENTPSASSGFGILDLAGTILPLAEKTMELDDDSRIKAGETKEYSFTIDNNQCAFKATLAWTDPPASAGDISTLVNDLDLVVRTPDGRIVYGNAFLNGEKADLKNNIEQVYIKNPVPGEYIISVRGTNFKGKSARQKFALVYGQALEEFTVSKVNNNKLVLTNGKEISLADVNLKNIVLNGKSAARSEIQKGSEIYLTANKVMYAVGKSWRADGTQIITTEAGDLLMETNSQNREGGYYIDPRAPSGSRGEIILNGQELEDLNQYPAGAEVQARVNPIYQTVWQISATYQEVSGYIAGFDLETGRINLIHDSNSYFLSKWASGSYNNKLIDCSVQDLPYGYGEKANMDKLLPGMKVTLVLSAGTNYVNYVKVDRDIVIGKVEYLDPKSGTLRLDTGSVYNLFPGTIIYKDGMEGSLDTLQAGAYITGLLLPGSNNLLEINTVGLIKYGRVIYCNTDNNIYYTDSQNRVIQGMMDGDTSIYQRGIPTDRASLVPGAWVRLGCRSDELIQRIDIADTAEVYETRFVAYYPENQLIVTEDGSRYFYAESTLLKKAGYCIKPEDLLPGEKIKITVLSSADKNYCIPAEIEVERIPGSFNPELQISAYSLNGALIIKGYSNANRIVLYRINGNRELIIPDTSGRISAVFKLLEGENRVQVLAIAGKNEGVSGRELTIEDYLPVNEVKEFTDLDSNYAREQIEDLARQGIIQGYEDGTFRPDQAISRVDMVAMLGKYLGLSPSGRGAAYFKDYNQIPWTATGFVTAAAESKIIAGYPDGSFRPFTPLTQSELAVILDKVLSSGVKDTFIMRRLNYSVPLWAQSAVSRGYERGILSKLWPEGIEADKPVTRAEAVMVLTWLD